MGLKLWLDDVRIPAEEWTWILTAEECLAVIHNTGLKNIDAISFDNDLGENQMEGYRVLDAIEEMIFTADELSSVPVLTVHSANPTARKRMGTVIDRINTYIRQFPT